MTDHDGESLSPHRIRVLYVTDLAYQARGRRYGDEDVFLSDRLRSDFDIALCHPKDAVVFMDSFDVVVVRKAAPSSTTKGTTTSSAAAPCRPVPGYSTNWRRARPT